MTAAVAEGRLLGLVSERLKKVRAPVNLRLWNGELIEAGSGRAPVTLAVHSPKALTRLANPNLGQLARSYVEGEIDLEGNFRDVLRLGEAFVGGERATYGHPARSSSCQATWPLSILSAASLPSADST